MTNAVVVLADDMKDAFLDYMPFTRSLGHRFTRARTNVAICAPARVGLLTGQLSKDNGVTTQGSGAAIAAFDRDNSVVKWIQDEGVRTGYFGKTINGESAAADAPVGYDAWKKVFQTLASDSYGFTMRTGGVDSVVNQQQTEWLADEVEAFMEAGPEPFFALLTPTSPHWPWSPEAADVGRWSRVDWPVNPSVETKPSWIQALVAPTAAEKAQIKSWVRGYIRELGGLDRLVQRIVTNAPPDTVVVFVADNGNQLGEHRIWGESVKNTLYEASARVPMVAWGPGFEAGETAVPTLLQDVTATMVAIFGATPGLTDQAGIDLRDIAADPEAYSTRSTLHFREPFGGDGFRTSDAVVQGEHKLIRHQGEVGTDEFELYYLDADPAEDVNHANDGGAFLTERDRLEVILDGLLG